MQKVWTAQNSVETIDYRIIHKLSHHLVPNAGTIVIVALLLFAYYAWAAPSHAPQATPASQVNTGLLSYQGYLTDTSDEPLDGEIDITFRLYSTSTGGTALWSEAHTESNAVPVEDGLFNVMLGSLTPIPSTVWSSGAAYLGVQVRNDTEMAPREVVGNVPTALTVPDGSVTLAKLDSTTWTDLPLEGGFHSPPNPDWQKAQYRRVGDIVYLRGLIVSDAHAFISSETNVAILPEGFAPPKTLAFIAEPHAGLTTKHRLDLHPNGEVAVQETAGNTPYVSLDGIFFSISP
jgi:hypothetical protein